MLRQLKLVRCMAVEGTDGTSSRLVTTSPPAAAATGSGRLLITDDMLSGALRRARPTGTGVQQASDPPARRQKSGDEQRSDGGVQSTADERLPAAGRRPKLPPVTMAQIGSGTTSAAGAEQDWLTRFAQRRTHDVIEDNN